MRRIVLNIGLCLAALGAWSQQVVEVGVLYQPGDSIYGPRSGVMTRIPEGWVGGAPEGSALFIMESTEHIDAQIFVNAGPDTIEDKKKRWQSGMRLSRSIDIVLASEITTNEEGTLISAEFKNVASPQTRIYAEGKCGDYGNCFVLFLMTWKGSYDAAREDLTAMMGNTKLVEPYLKNLHVDFDWPAFLEDKLIYAYLYDAVQEKSTNLWLCGDGTFRMELKRKGAAIVKSSKRYYGKTAGTWQAEGTGPTGKVTLNFSKAKLGAHTFEIEIRENRFYVDNEQFFVARNNTCK